MKKDTTPSAPVPLDGIQRVALSRALVLLRAAGVQFAVIDHDGTVHGTLELRPPTKSGRARGHRVNNFQQMYPGYSAKVVALEVGSSLSWQAADKEQAEAFRKAVSSIASKTFGSGKTMTTLAGKTKDVVEILRLE